MIILGLHFGHDAAAAVLRDGVVVAHVVKERLNRTKRAMAMSGRLIDAALDAAGVPMAAVDHVALVTTQGHGFVCDRDGGFDIAFHRHPDDPAPSPMADFLAARGVDPRRLLTEGVSRFMYPGSPRADGYYESMFPESAHIPHDQLFNIGGLHRFLEDPAWRTPRSLDELAKTDFSASLADENQRLGLHFPVTATFRGATRPACVIQHHMAHAASVYYPGRLERAAVFTHDGGVLDLENPANNGLFVLGDGRRLRPIAPHGVTIGAFYEYVAMSLGFGRAGGPGKLMGLAAYGRPRLHDRRFVGNAYEWRRLGLSDPFYDWAATAHRKAAAMGYDLSCYAKAERITERFNVDFAASAQKLFEEITLAAAEALAALLDRMGISTADLCVAGGAGLNCPANERLRRESPFSRIHVRPDCDDSGLAAGAAYALYHNVLDQPLPAAVPADAPTAPYLGPVYSAQAITAALEKQAGRIAWSRPPDPAAAAACDLADGRVIAWFEGRSEVGPRALGHRSILADPRDAGNWARVNRLKGREAWRPFAPAVLQDCAADWFGDMDAPSPFMLFTRPVRRPDVIPAATHVDGTARVQTVGPEVGGLHPTLCAFHRLTGVPVLLNTSFNGPGEPIIERPDEAIAFLLKTELDVLYLDGWRATRRDAAIAPRQT